jgi:hypothetical protein
MAVGHCFIALITNTRLCDGSAEIAINQQHTKLSFLQPPQQWASLMQLSIREPKKHRSDT